MEETGFFTFFIQLHELPTSISVQITADFGFPAATELLGRELQTLLHHGLVV